MKILISLSNHSEEILEFLRNRLTALHIPIKKVTVERNGIVDIRLGKELFPEDMDKTAKVKAVLNILGKEYKYMDDDDYASKYFKLNVIAKGRILNVYAMNV